MFNSKGENMSYNKNAKKTEFDLADTGDFGDRCPIMRFKLHNLT